MELFFNAKFDFKSVWNRDSTTSHHKHPVYQSPAGEAEKLTNVWSRYFGMNRIIDNWHQCLGECDVNGKIILKNYFKINLWTVNFHFIDPQNYLHIMRTFLNHIKNETLDEIKTSLENLWQWMIQLSEFLAATKQLYEWYFLSVCPSVRLSVRLSHLFDYVTIIVSSWNFQELSHWTRVRSMQKVKVRGQRSRSQRSRPKFSFPDCNSSLNSHMMMKWYI